MRKVDPIEALLGRRLVRTGVRLEDRPGEQSGGFTLEGEQLLIQSALLVCPERNSREYQTQITVESGPDDAPVFTARSLWGPSGRVTSHKKVLYTGSDLSQAVMQANKMVEQKLGREYQPTQAGAHTRISLAAAINRLNEIRS